MSNVRKIALISCSAEKLGRRAPAQELYTSQLFKKSAAWVRQQGITEWFVISAMYGLVRPEQPLPPYNYTMRNKTPEERAAWNLEIATYLDAWIPEGEQVEIVLMAGEAYAGWIPMVAPFAKVTQPMQGMQIGERLQFLTHGVRSEQQEDLFA